MADIARLTGWSLDFILWHLPWGGGLGLLHAEGIFHGATLRRVHASNTRGNQREVKSMRADFAAMKAARGHESEMNAGILP